MPAATKFKVSTYEEDRHAENYSHMVKLQDELRNLDYNSRAAYNDENAARKRYATDWEHVRTIHEDDQEHGGLIEHVNVLLDQ